MGRQTLFLAVDAAVTHELAPGSLSLSLGGPRKYYLRISPMEKRVFVTVQVSRGEVPAYHWSKKNMSLDTLESLTGTVNFTFIIPSPRRHSLGPRKFFLAWDFYCGKK